MPSSMLGMYYLFCYCRALCVEGSLTMAMTCIHSSARGCSITGKCNLFFQCLYFPMDSLLHCSMLQHSGEILTRMHLSNSTRAKIFSVAFHKHVPMWKSVGQQLELLTMPVPQEMPSMVRWCSATSLLEALFGHTL